VSFPYSPNEFQIGSVNVRPEEGIKPVVPGIMEYIKLRYMFQYCLCIRDSEEKTIKFIPEFAFTEYVNDFETLPVRI